MTTTIEMDISGVVEDLEKLKNVDTRKIMAGVGVIIEASIVAEIDLLGLVNLGAFRNSVSVEEVTETSVTVSDGVEYGIYLEEGTRPHVIRPTSRKSLRFEANGDVVFSKFVLHPGTRAYRPFRRGTHKAVPELTSFINEQLLSPL